MLYEIVTVHNYLIILDFPLGHLGTPHVVFHCSRLIIGFLLDQGFGLHSVSPKVYSL